MRPTRMLLAVAAPALALILGSPAPAQKHDGHDHGGHQHPPAQHGGTLASSGSYRFEVVFKKDGLAVYPHGPSISPMVITQMSGQAYFLMPGASKYSRPYTLRPAAGRGGPADSLGLAVDLSRVPASGARVTIRVLGLPDADGSRAEFTVPFTLNEPGALTVAAATRADEAAIARQRLCPVSGEELGSMGGPLKVSRGGSTTFLCCKGCLPKVEADPDKFLAEAAEALTVAAATRADEAAIARQRLCPVSGEELGSMGGPLKVSRGGSTTFLCCKGCLPKVEADPDKYLRAAAAAEAQADHGHPH